MKTRSTAIAALVVLGALVAAAPGVAEPRVHGNDRGTFNVSGTPASSCAGFFSQQLPETDGWSGQLHEAWVFDPPIYTNITIRVNGTWTDSATGMSYRIRFKGDGSGPAPFPLAQGDVDIRRSDGWRLSGSAEYAGDQGIVSLDTVSCG